ncbi:hypothetical protein A1F94_010342 [Pyrenophora tritici-repentis]|nr:hypothetical protein A1F94_010342 [Pyrenophora tritici-repentis]
MLQTLELSVWGWSVGMALALRSLRALRTFRVRVERVTGVGRNVPRKWIAVQRAEEKKAWEVLVSGPEEELEEVVVVSKRRRRRKRGFWSERLTTLELENCDVTAEQLGVVLSKSRGCREVRLDGCRILDKELWTVMGEWEGRSGLERLDVVDCGGRIGEEARTAIGLMDGLKDINLYDCQEQDPGSMQQCNDELWHIPDFVAPAPARGVGQNMIIEVDPEYM